MIDFRQKLFFGLKWLGLLRAFGRGLLFARTVILARLLLPEQFGLFGVATIAITVFEVLTETGVNYVLIQEDGKIDKWVDTAWVVSIVRGLVIFLFMLGSAGLVKHFFQIQGTAGVIVLAAFSPLVKGFINPVIISFQKELKFKKEFVIRALIIVAESIFMVWFTWVWRTVEGMVVGLVAASLFEVVLSFIFCRPWPKPVFQLSRFRTIASRGKWITLNGILASLVDQADDALVGRMLGVSSLGLYQMAYKISNLPFTEITDVLAKVSFPLYRRIQSERLIVRANFRQVVLVNLLLVVPGSVAIFLLAEPIVNLFLGPAWTGSIPAIKILAFFGLTKAIGGLASPILLAYKRQDYITRIEAAKLVLLALLIVPLTARFGIAGTAWAVTLSSLFLQPIIYYTVRKVLT